MNMQELVFWVKWVVASVAAALTMMGYVHGNFMTVREKFSLEARLERIEAKIDSIIQGERRSK